MVEDQLASVLILFSKPLLFMVNYLFGITIEDRINQYFIGVIFCVFVFFILVYIVKAVKSWMVLANELKRINTLVEDDEILPSHSSSFAGLSNNCKLFSRILINYNGKLYATQDVESTVGETWAPDILQSKVFPTVAAILTGLGVLGTFVGLLIGLKQLDLGGSIIDMKEIQTQIQGVANAASIAFMTSVCGVFLSLVFTLVERLFLGWVAGALRKLQRRLALLFQPLPIMQVFTDMNKATQDSRDILGGLAEQIGNRMQNALDSISENIIAKLAGSMAEATKIVANAVSESGTDLRGAFDTKAGELAKAIEQSGEATLASLEDVKNGISRTVDDGLRNIPEAVQNGIALAISDKLAPAIERIAEASDGLAQRQATGAEEALKELVREFTDSMGAEGENQRQALIKTTSELNDAFTTFMGELRGFIEPFQHKQKAIIDGISQEISTATSQVGSNIARMAGELDSFLTQLKNYQNGISSEQDERAKYIEKSIDNVFESQKTSLLEISTIVHNNVTATERLLSQGNTLQERIESGRTLLDKLAVSIQQASGSLNQASGKLEKFGTSISSSMEQGSKAVGDAVGVVREIARWQDEATMKLGEVIGEMGEVRSGLEGVRSGFETVGESLSGAADTAQKGFETATGGFDKLSEVYTTFQRTLLLFVKDMQEKNKQQIVELDGHMTKLMNEYSEAVNQQVSNRMNEWNKQTEQFCKSMESVVQVMSFLVSDIDIKRR